MENAYVLDAEFLDGKTIRLSEECPFEDRRIRLIVIPGRKEASGEIRKAGLLKGKIRMSEDFGEPLEDMREYME